MDGTLLVVLFNEEVLLHEDISNACFGKILGHEK